VQHIAKTLIVCGAVLIGTGFLLLLFHKIPFLGRLPGDVYIQRKNVTFYFPLMTSLLVSVILSLFFWLSSRR
jgi:hypothetical protein